MIGNQELLVEDGRQAHFWEPGGVECGGGCECGMWMLKNSIETLTTSNHERIFTTRLV